MVQCALEPRSPFAGVVRDGGVLRCQARDAAAPADYFIRACPTGYAVGLETADRWLSESIESSLMHGRDALEDLVEEELVDLGGAGAIPQVKHFRSPERRYTFECEFGAGTDAAADAARALLHLLAFEAAFRQLGDMESGGGD